MQDNSEPPEGVHGRLRLSGRDVDRPGLVRRSRPAHEGGEEEGQGAEGSRRGAMGRRGTTEVSDEPATPPGSGVSSRLPSPPAALRMMADFWKARLAELESPTAAETRPDMLASLAFERLCVRGILAGLDDR